MGSPNSFKPVTLPPGWGNVLGLFLQSFSGFATKQSQNRALGSLLCCEKEPEASGEVVLGLYINLFRPGIPPS